MGKTRLNLNDWLGQVGLDGEGEQDAVALAVSIDDPVIRAVAAQPLPGGLVRELGEAASAVVDGGAAPGAQRNLLELAGTAGSFPFELLGAQCMGRLGPWRLFAADLGTARLILDGDEGVLLVLVWAECVRAWAADTLGRVQRITGLAADEDAAALVAAPDSPTPEARPEPPAGPFAFLLVDGGDLGEIQAAADATSLPNRRARAGLAPWRPDDGDLSTEGLVECLLPLLVKRIGGLAEAALAWVTADQALDGLFSLIAELWYLVDQAEQVTTAALGSAPSARVPLAFLPDREPLGFLEEAGPALPAEHRDRLVRWWLTQQKKLALEDGLCLVELAWRHHDLIGAVLSHAIEQPEAWPADALVEADKLCLGAVLGPEAERRSLLLAAWDRAVEQLDVVGGF